MTPNDTVRETALLLLEETFPSRDKGGNVYVDKRTGWFPTLEGLTAEEASLSIVPGGTTVASHVFHSVFYLDVVTTELKGGELGKVDWSRSWVVTVVRDEEWEELKRHLRDAYEEVMTLLEGAEEWGPGHVEVAFAALAHSAYHLGAVRQFLTLARDQAENA